jgi:A/G-specific adenine glycosylase
MLQQTQVATVVPYYERFLTRFPDPYALAEATEEEVLGFWSGLGYYRRARALRAGAQVVVERHGGALPRDPEALRALPGIGRYTAGAIASIAFDLPEPILDGNVRRVLARLNAVDGSGKGRAAEEQELWGHAGKLVRGRNPGDLNQALMELGATICVPVGPHCGSCPVTESCRARSEGRPEAYPRRRPGPASSRSRAAVAVVWRAGRLLLERPAPLSPFRGSWDLPALELDAASDGAEPLRTHLARSYGLELAVEPAVGEVAHGIMNRRLTLSIHRCRHLRGSAAKRSELRWIEPEELDRAAVSGATHKVLRTIS